MPLVLGLTGLAQLSWPTLPPPLLLPFTAPPPPPLPPRRSNLGLLRTGRREPRGVDSPVTLPSLPDVLLLPERVLSASLDVAGTRPKAMAGRLLPRGRCTGGVLEVWPRAAEHLRGTSAIEQT